MALSVEVTNLGGFVIKHENGNFRLTQEEAQVLIKDLKLLTLENYYVIRPEIARKLPIEANQCFMKYDVAENYMFVGAKEKSSNLIKTTFTKAEFKKIMMNKRDDSLFKEMFEVASPSW